MTRIRSVSSRRHRKVLDLAKGFKQSRRRRYKVAHEAVMHAGQYAYEGRKNKKRDLRSLWIVRLSAALKERGSSYSKFISSLNKSKIEINRKVLSDISVKDPNSFTKIVDSAK